MNHHRAHYTFLVRTPIRTPFERIFLESVEFGRNGARGHWTVKPSRWRKGAANYYATGTLLTDAQRAKFDEGAPAGWVVAGQLVISDANADTRVFIESQSMVRIRGGS